MVIGNSFRTDFVESIVRSPADIYTAASYTSSATQTLLNQAESLIPVTVPTPAPIFLLSFAFLALLSRHKSRFRP